MAIGRVKKGDPPQYAPIRLGADLHVTFLGSGWVSRFEGRFGYWLYHSESCHL